MRYPSVVVAIAAVAPLVIPLQTEAQTRQRQLGQSRSLVLSVTPRSFLDRGPVVPVDSINPGYTGYGQTQPIC